MSNHLFIQFLGVIAGVLSSLDTVSSPSFHSDTLTYHSNQFFVNLDSAVEEDTIVALLEDLNATELWRSGHLDIALWEVNEFPFTTVDGETILNIHDAILRSKKKTKIHDATLNIQQQMPFLPGASSTCFDISEFALIHGDSSVIKISILDTGISELTDNSTGQLNYDLMTYTGYDYVQGDQIPDDEHGHGTHITGIIHSITHQVSPASGKISFDIRKTHDFEGKAYLSAVVMALLDALDADADIINMSFGYRDIYHDTLFFPLQIAIEEAKNKDALVVVAAGNDGLDNDGTDSTALPASMPSENILTVASLDCNNQLSMFSNYGYGRVDLAVLGENIPGPDLASGIVYGSGTSQAAAIVTAAAALRGTYIDDFTPQKVICPLIAGSHHLLSLTDALVSSGMLNLQQSLFINDSTCLQNPFDCHHSWTGSNILDGTISLGKIYETDQEIETSQLLQSGSMVTYDALGTVTMEPGFEVQPGAVLQIQNDGCTH